MASCWWVINLLAISFFSKSWAELITALPTQPSNISFKQYSGYITTDTLHGRALFYYFVEASVADPLSRPLTLWLNGGPGCSSLGYGAFMEHGPFRVGDNGLLIQNPYSWNLESNMLYVESPIGVGFSYSNTSEDYINWNDTRTAEENLRFVLNWLEEFPQYKDSDFYLTGESYAGHYIPQLAALILEHDKNTNIKPIKLKAIALGNPLLDMDISVNTGDYLWAHGVISDETWMLEKTICNDSRYMAEALHNKLSQECINVFNRVNNETGPDIDDSDLLLPRCLLSSTGQQSISTGTHARIHTKVGGWAQSFGKLREGKNVTYLTYATVRGGAHEVPFTSPSQALTLFKAFLSGSPLPRN